MSNFSLEDAKEAAYEAARAVYASEMAEEKEYVSRHTFTPEELASRVDLAEQAAEAAADCEFERTLAAIIAKATAEADALEAAAYVTKANLSLDMLKAKRVEAIMTLDLGHPEQVRLASLIETIDWLVSWVVAIKDAPMTQATLNDLDKLDDLTAQVLAQARNAQVAQDALMAQALARDAG